ncbi:MAG: nicotinate-nucleotide diphosphorylase (carboxylating), partial [Candidatus Omnitrophica bacterium CG22_combo_CG10-13_8_21_14_all_43_16]
ITTKEECVLAGMDIAKWIFDAVDEKILFTALCKDGDKIKKGKRIISVKGSAKNILSAERTVLNFLGHLSGVATLTAEFIGEVKSTGAKIYDTRKTIPGLRELEKYAVNIGGGFSYRIGLWDGVMIKDNHLEAIRVNAIRESIGMFQNRGYKNIEVEVDNIAEFKDALEAGADIIMLDNMKIEDIKKAAKLRKGLKVILEASGGISMENIKKIAKAGVDRISIGRLTHSAPSIDFSLEI